jgi:hypothetical protein
MIAKTWWFSILIAVALVALVAWWAQQTRSVNLVKINVSADAPHLIPVYAQFDVTQTVTMPTFSPVTNLELPLVMPAQPTGELLVDLQQHEQLLQRWHIQLADHAAQANQTVTLTLPLMPHRWVEDDLEIQVAAPQLDAHFPEQAPQVLIEDDDQGYPDGNYRIAQNEKRGDMGLGLWVNQTNWKTFRSIVHAQPVAAVRTVMPYGLISLLLLNLPQLLWRRWAHTTPDTSEQSS